MRIALVVGGAGGLGRAAATRFAQDGMAVVVADLDGDVAEKVAATLPGQGRRRPPLVMVIPPQHQSLGGYSRSQTLPARRSVRLSV
ncbi:SDR family NAD(P)-dependent oxidoreductase [Brenneria tiliae]|uniref:SDR family NAD(P)-dependent oxidoreductase n=1 Tax=Brenneria tiliae TaxID=2914984 RepID=UPI003204E10B